MTPDHHSNDEPRLSPNQRILLTLFVLAIIGAGVIAIDWILGLLLGD